MKKFWELIAHNAVKVAVYAVGHSDQVIAIVQAVQAAKK